MPPHRSPRESTREGGEEREIDAFFEHATLTPEPSRRPRARLRVVHLGRSTCHAISGRSDESTRIPDGRVLSSHRHSQNPTACTLAAESLGVC